MTRPADTSEWPHAGCTFLQRGGSFLGGAPVPRRDRGGAQAEVVYITETGAKYHRASCNSLQAGKIEMPLVEAADYVGRGAELKASRSSWLPASCSAVRQGREAAALLRPVGPVRLLPVGLE